jgi:hypothetical protein
MILEHDPEKACPRTSSGADTGLEKIMLKQQAKAKCRFKHKLFRFRGGAMAKPDRRFAFMVPTLS